MYSPDTIYAAARVVERGGQVEATTKGLLIRGLGLAVRRM